MCDRSTVYAVDYENVANDPVSSIPKYVRDQLLLAVATIMKRGFMEWSEASREGMFINIKELWDMNNEHAVSILVIYEVDMDMINIGLTLFHSRY